MGWLAGICHSVSVSLLVYKVTNEGYVPSIGYHKVSEEP